MHGLRMNASFSYFRERTFAKEDVKRLQSRMNSYRERESLCDMEERSVIIEIAGETRLPAQFES